MNKRTMSFSAVLMSCILFGSLSAVSCGEDDADPAETGTDVRTAAVTEAETAPSRVRADLPERDFGGETFTLFARIYEGAWTADDIAAEDTNGEIINDAIFDRTAYIEDTYHVSLRTVPGAGGTLLPEIKTFVSAGETIYDAVVCNVYDAGGAALEHMLLDLNEVEYLDFSKPWWSQMMNQSLTIGGRQYYAAGDIFIVDNKATRVFFFNKDMIAEQQLENPYQLVFENRWTVDQYMKLSNAVTADLNGDHVLKRKDDRYGTMAQGTLGTVLYFAAGETLTAKDADDFPVIACESDRAVSVMTAISDLMTHADSISLSGENRLANGKYTDNFVYFMDGKVLFAPDVLKQIENMRDCAIDIGIVPPPKFDEAQEGYFCYADGWCVNTVSIPVTNAAPEKVGFLLEAMAADSVNNLTPAYYEVALTDKYVRDRESVEMLDLILSSVVMDNANIFQWGNNIEETLASAISRGGNIASTLEKRHKVFQNGIAKTVDALLSEG